jgi:hypothetical protein
MTQKLLNLVNEWGKYWKVFDDRYMFSDEQFYPSNYILIQLNPHTTLIDDREVMDKFSSKF